MDPVVSGTAALGTEVLEARSDLEVRSDLEDLGLRSGSGVLAARSVLEALEPPSLVLSFSAKIIKEQLTRISPDNQPYLTQELLTTHTPVSKRHLNFTPINYDRFVKKTKKELPPQLL
ncbi:hypothetical protein [Paenibacillus chitinolyticus]|uniref:hypothetical protein n=1 Tax=Paenibacillus chitinolyticus TaxID=79263 RepID=UPI003641CBA0